MTITETLITHLQNSDGTILKSFTVLGPANGVTSISRKHVYEAQHKSMRKTYAGIKM